MSHEKDRFHEELRNFVAEHEDGWSHGHWETLLRRLEEEGFDTAQPDAIGLVLERERILVALEDAGIPGLGPKRREAVADQFGNLWRLKQASVDDLSRMSRLPKALAEKVHAAVS
jgi:hypothetical protein